MRIVLGLIDGTKYEATADVATFGCLADRVAFERRFGVSAAVLTKIEEFIERDPEGGATIIDADGMAEALREEHLLFLAWRELMRRCPELPDDFDTVLESAASLSFEGSIGGSEPDPSRAAAPPTAG